MSYEWLRKGAIVDSIKDGRTNGIIVMSHIYMSGYSYTVKWPDGKNMTYWTMELVPHQPDGNTILKDLL